MSQENEIDLSVHRGFRVGGWLVQSSLNRLTRGDEVVQRITETGAADVVPLAEALAEARSAGIEGQQTPRWNHILQLARERGAGLLLSGAHYLDGENLRLQVRLTDGATADLIYAFEPVEVSREAAAEAVDTLRERVAAAVAAHLHPSIDITVQRPPSSYEAYQAFLRGYELLEVWGATPPWPEVIAHYRRALEIDPDFHRAQTAGIVAHLNAGDVEGAWQWLSIAEAHLERMTPYEQTRVQYGRANLEMDYGGALNAARRAVELAPRLTFLRMDLGLSAQYANRPREAV